MKNVIANKIYYLKKGQRLLSTSKEAGAEAVFDSVSQNRYSQIHGKWVLDDRTIGLMRHEFFKVFTDKKPI